MNKKVKAKWVAALRSDEYHQGRNHLRNDEGFCCLGVLTDIYIKENAGEWVKQNNDRVSYNPKIGGEVQSSFYLPDCVTSWAGLDKEGHNPVVESGGVTVQLADLNDGTSTFERKDFSAIADIIEAQY